MWYNQRYKSVGERAADAQKKLKKLQKKDPSINPVIIEGKQIATTWWGKAWTSNLKYYADIDNRVGRGRSYVKNGLVIHLSLKKGLIEGMVVGTSSQPYKIKIKIKSLSDAKWKRITALSQKHLHSLMELLEGSFPRELENVFSNTAEGIFPSLKEMNFGCTCPDWASMCKHVSAVLYATGKRLDEDPGLIFQLRGVNIQDLIGQALKKEVDSLSKKGPQTHPKNQLRLSEKKLSSLFNIKVSTEKLKKRARNKR